MPRPSVVLDTNVVVSAHLNPFGNERFALDLALAEKIQLYISPQIFKEYLDVLGRTKLGIEPTLVAASLELIKQKSRMVHPSAKIHAASDEDDNRFLECAQEGNVDFLVTGNKRHFPRSWKGTLVVNTRELLEVLIPDLNR